GPQAVGALLLLRPRPPARRPPDLGGQGGEQGRHPAGVPEARPPQRPRRQGRVRPEDGVRGAVTQQPSRGGAVKLRACPRGVISCSDDLTSGGARPPEAPLGKGRQTCLCTPRPPYGLAAGAGRVAHTPPAPATLRGGSRRGGDSPSGPHAPPRHGPVSADPRGRRSPASPVPAPFKSSRCRP